MRNTPTTTGRILFYLGGLNLKPPLVLDAPNMHAMLASANLLTIQPKTNSGAVTLAANQNKRSIEDVKDEFWIRRNK